MQSLESLPLGGSVSVLSHTEEEKKDYFLPGLQVENASEFASALLMPDACTRLLSSILLAYVN